MTNGELPNPNVMFPVPNINTVTYIKPTIKNKNIIVGDFTYFRDVDFEKWNEQVPPMDVMPIKGDTIIGNDVWIGQDATILPGVNIGDGVIIGTKSVVAKNIEPYSIVVGNPARVIRKRFDDELIALLQAFKWWDLPIAFQSISSFLCCMIVIYQE
jgi:virginiamycin A acetyltransferase